MDVERDVTLLVKTLMRPAKLERLLQSVRAQYPNLAIVVCDDGPEEYHLAERVLAAASPGLEYRRYPLDIGVGHCYNDALQYVGTPYTAICDDDCRFLDETRIETWLPHMGTYTLLGGAVRRGDSGRLQQYVGGFQWLLAADEGGHGRMGEHRVRMRRSKIDGLTAPIRADFVMNWFLAETSFLQANPWDERLKVCRHEDYFLGLHWLPPSEESDWLPAPLLGAKVGYHPGVVIDHDRERGPRDLPQYLALRSKRFPEFRAIVEAKWGLQPGGLMTP